jgi:hypothetical protein
LLFGQAGWHTDSGHDVASAKVAAYLDPLDAASGALRVLRCSHHVPHEQPREVLRRLALQDDAAGRKATQAVPGLLLPLLRRLLPSHCPSRWVNMLERLGAFAAAAAEEAAGRLPPPRSPEPQEHAARSEDA